MIGPLNLILLAAGAYVAYRLLKGRPSPPAEHPPAETGEYHDDMVEDPQCGVYFPKSKGFPAKVDGRPLLFCSEACRDAYLARYAPHDPDRPAGQDKS